MLQLLVTEQCEIVWPHLPQLANKGSARRAPGHSTLCSQQCGQNPYVKAIMRRVLSRVAEAIHEDTVQIGWRGWIPNILVEYGALKLSVT